MADYPWSSDDESSGDFFGSANTALSQLMDMGYSRSSIRKAAESVGADITHSNLELIIDILNNAGPMPGRSSPPIAPYSPQCAEPDEPPDEFFPQRSFHNYDPKPVQIVSPHQDGRKGYLINEAEIKRIFQQPIIANTPVAIYSVAGAFRQGKSFILNFFVRYLRCQRDETTSKWLQSKQDVLNKGFVWRGGANKHTQGIWIWDEPFFIDTPDGKVALFLMDTQGSFDPHSSVKDCSVIFGLSTLISSVQIYNVSKQLQEDTLQHLQLFTEYGKAAKRMQNRDEKAFQDLIFLIRDWADPDYKFDFDGGEKLLQTVLKAPLQHKDTESVRKNLRDSFERVSCCLMPYPGETVAVRREQQRNELRLGDVNGNFLRSVDILVQRLFSRDLIVLKKVNNKFVTGKELVNYTLAYFGVFASGDMPEVGTILEATAKAAILTTLQECKDMYRKEMEKRCKNVFIQENEFANIHEACKTKALERFDQKSKFGDDAFIKQYRKNLKGLLEQEFAVYEQANKTHKERSKLEASEAAADTEKMFEEALENCSGGQYVEEQALREIVQSSREEALRQYEEKTNKLPQDIAGKYQQKLHGLIDQALKRFKESNSHKKEDLRRQLEKKSLVAIQKYTQSMDTECNDVVMSKEEFESAHLKAMDVAMKSFEESNIGKNTEQGKDEKDLLITRIKNEEINYRKANEMNEKLARSETLETMKEAKRVYTSGMEEVCGRGHIEETELANAHEESKQNAMVIISSVETHKGSSFVQKCLSQFDDFIDSEYKKLKRKNDNIKEEEINRLQRAKNKAYYMYQTRMDELTEKYMDENQLKKQHEREKRKALNYFSESETRRTTNDSQQLRNKLNREINDHYDILCERNDEQRTLVEQAAQKTLQEIKEEYMKYMNKLCDGQYVETMVLEKTNEAICRDIQNRIEKEIPVSEVAQKMAKEFHQYASDQFINIRQANEKNKTVWYQTIGPKVGDALLYGATVFFNNASHPKRWIVAGFSGLTKLLTSFNDDKDGSKKKAFDTIIDKLPGALGSSVDPQQPKDSSKTSPPASPTPPPSPPPPYSKASTSEKH